MSQILVLDVADRREPVDPGAHRRMFSRAGGSIGRSTRCDLVLSAPGVSRLHAVVYNASGEYYLNDKSRYGTRLNGRPMTKGETAVLGNGDRFEIDRFEVSVRIGDATELELPLPHAKLGQTINRVANGDFLEDSTGDRGDWKHGGRDRADGFFSFRGPDRRQAPRASIPAAGFRRDESGGQAGEQTDAAKARHQIERMNTEELHALFRVVAEGLMTNLSSRAEIKNNMGMAVTLMQRDGNNPLQFSPDAEAALDHIFSDRSDKAYLSGEDAFEDALVAIQDHQRAMLAAIRGAFDRMLERFDPADYERAVDKRRKEGGGMQRFGNRNSAYWQHYRDAFHELSENPDERFQRLFGDEFVKAYDEQLAELRMRRER